MVQSSNLSKFVVKSQYNMFLYVYSFCSCDEPNQKSSTDDIFPSTNQMWGMIGTVLATIACWIFYTKVNHKHNTRNVIVGLIYTSLLLII